jgi:hypothetical protein
MKYRITTETAIADLYGGAGYRAFARYALRTRLSPKRRAIARLYLPIRRVMMMHMQ